jgi:hypothetical protein
MSSVPTNPSAKMLSPVVTRPQCQWGAVVRSESLAFVISSVVVGVLVAVPVPSLKEYMFPDEGAYYYIIPFLPV